MSTETMPLLDTRCCPDHRPWEVRAQLLRVGRQLLTDDGWQTIRGLVVFADADQVSVFTDERDDLETDGWRFTFDQPVQTRHLPGEAVAQWRRRLVQRERRRLRRLAMAAANCPEWCVEHYDAGAPVQRNHASVPCSIDAANAWTGDHVEVGFWLERRDDQETGKTETVGILECKTMDDVEMTPDAMRQLAQKLMSLADRAEMKR